MSSERRALLYIEDVIEHAQHAIRFVDGRTEEDLLTDLMLQFAVVRAVEVVGEACRSIPEEVRVLAPEVPWRQIATTRNKIVHHYFGVRLDVVWRVVQDELPPLIGQMERLLTLLQASETPNE